MATMVIRMCLNVICTLPVLLNGYIRFHQYPGHKALMTDECIRSIDGIIVYVQN